MGAARMAVHEDVRELGVQDFARLFGVAPGELPEACRRMIAGWDFRYRVPEAEERDAIVLAVCKRIDSGSLSLAGKEGKARWDRGWSENLSEFGQSHWDLSKLVPRYIRPGDPLRLHQGYVVPLDPDFELHWYEVFRTWLFQTTLAPFDAIYEFGCGSGFNVAALAQMFPEKTIHGLDWAAASADTCNKLAEVFGWKTQGHLFDFFAPDAGVKLGEGSALLTVGALEQTHTNFEAFLQYLLAAKPGLCVHVEPICEWYEEDRLEDYLAIRFHTVRNYWRGFPRRLQELAREGRVEILKAKRSCFGSQFIEGYSQLIWRPL
jgi:hypothetical protein